MAENGQNQIGIKMKKLETIRKEQKKLQRFIRDNIASYSRNLRIKDKLNEALIVSNTLIWVQLNCRWTPSGLILND